MCPGAMDHQESFAPVPTGSDKYFKQGTSQANHQRDYRWPNGSRIHLKKRRQRNEFDSHVAADILVDDFLDLCLKTLSPESALEDQKDYLQSANCPGDMGDSK